MNDFLSVKLIQNKNQIKLYKEKISNIKSKISDIKGKS